MGVKRAKITCDVSGNHKTLKVDGAGEWDTDAIEDGNGNVAKCEYHPLAINQDFLLRSAKLTNRLILILGRIGVRNQTELVYQDLSHTHHNIKNTITKKESVTLLFLIVPLVNFIIDELVST